MENLVSARTRRTVERAREIIGDYDPVEADEEFVVSEYSNVEDIVGSADEECDEIVIE
jgi:hypothetical protein